MVQKDLIEENERNRYRLTHRCDEEEERLEREEVGEQNTIRNLTAATNVGPSLFFMRKKYEKPIVLKYASTNIEHTINANGWARQDLVRYRYRERTRININSRR